MPTTILEKKIEKTTEIAEKLKNKTNIQEKTGCLRDEATRLRQSLHRLEIGDTVKIVWVLKSPNFEEGYAREKMKAWIEGRKRIIEYGMLTAKIPECPAKKTEKSKWRKEKFSLKGKVLGRIGKNLWKIEVSIGTEDCKGAFSGKELIFIERPRSRYQN
jgi:hypothetical protein